MPTVLLVYATTHGHTTRIAERIAAVLRTTGAHVDVHAIDSAGAPAPGGYDAVVAGGSVHAGHHQRPLAQWVAGHAESLSAMPSAFFSVSLSAAEDTPSSREAVHRYVGDFLDETGWVPGGTMSFAGSLQYREYGFFLRRFMRRLMRRGNHPTDTSRDHEFTDWDEVERFAREFAERVVPVTAGAAA